MGWQVTRSVDSGGAKNVAPSEYADFDSLRDLFTTRHWRSEAEAARSCSSPRNSARKPTLLRTVS
jgi:hypothetical protein